VLEVERWAEIRRMSRVERLSQREIARRTGLNRRTARAENGGVRLHRNVLQPETKTLKTRLDLTRRVRGGGIPPPQKALRDSFTLKDNP